MGRLLLAVSLFAAVLPLSGQTAEHADLGLEYFIPSRLTVGTEFLAYGYVRNYGPDTARNVVITTSFGRFFDQTNCIPDDAGRCTIEQLPPGSELSVSVVADGQVVQGPVTLNLEVTSTIADPNTANNSATGTIDFVLAPVMRFSIYGGFADPGSTVQYETYIANVSEIAATNVTFTLPLTDGWTFERSLSSELQCTQTGSAARCEVARIEPLSEIRPRFVLRAPNTPEGAPFQSTPVALTTEHGVLEEEHWTPVAWFATTIYRHLTVTHTADDGEGSLRAAIQATNATCAIGSAPCKIVFDIAAASSHHTIRPLTPLPALTASVVIDGATQSARHGDTNPAGPEVEVNGSLLTAGDGIASLGPDIAFTLKDVVVNGFPGNGVVIGSNGYSRLLERNYIGTDVTGQHAVPNGGRGVVLDTGKSYGYMSATLRDNVISGNGRSGVFVVNSFEVHLRGNRIGATAGERPLPLGNGSAGVFIGPGSSAVTINKNVIAYNGESGVATAGSSGYTEIRANAIFENSLLGIDHGLDLATPPPPPGQEGTVPVITAAHYDAATNSTRIEGRVPLLWSRSLSEVELYANTSPGLDGYAQGELYLGSVRLESMNFTFDHPGDLRGRYITATFTQPNNYWPEIRYLTTSEFSRGLLADGDAAGPIDPAATVPRGADISVTLSTSYRLHAEMPARVYTSLANLGPETARDVVVELTTDHGRLGPASPSCEQVGTGLRCTLPELTSVSFDVEAPAGPASVTLRARVVAANYDPNPSNNEATLTIPVTTEPMLAMRIASPGAVDPGALADYTVYIAHQSVVAARDIEIHIALPRDWSLVDGTDNGWHCSQEDGRLNCRKPLMEGMTAESFTYTLRAPGTERRRESARVSVATSGRPQQDAYTSVVYETFLLLPVTSTADDGPGSLRDAITAANAVCGEFGFYCKIVFAIPAESATNGVFTIRPARALPRIEAMNVLLDARTQAAHGGDTNPLGPEVELNGSLMPSGNGLDAAAKGDLIIRGLAINGFPENGVAVRVDGYPWSYVSRRAIVDNYIGTDPTGRIAVPNGGRGLTVETSEEFWTKLDIVNNVISGNDRAGIFIGAGRSIRIAGNRIGVDPADQPLANGASGVYLGRTEGVTVEGNRIAFNGHAGVAVDRSASWNTIRGNAIFDNGGLGVDHALDTVTFNDAPDRREDLPRFPVILSARWDEAAKVTRIEGRVEGHPWNLPVVVEVFANAAPDGSAHGEAQRSMGERVLPRSREEQSFRFETPLDLRGQFVTATLIRRGNDSVRQGWTSEISQAVPVQ